MIPRFFYGWWIVAAAVLLQFTFLSISQSTVSVFLRPVVEDMGWQVWQFTLGSSLAVMAGALSGVVVGRIVDQRGPRLLVLGGALVSAICLFGLGRQSNLWLFWTLHVSAGFIGWTLFGPLVVNTTINKWFVRRRGWALAIGSSGISLGGLIAPLAMTLVVDSLGWRNGYFVQAIFVPCHRRTGRTAHAANSLRTLVCDQMVSRVGASEATRRRGQLSHPRTPAAKPCALLDSGCSCLGTA